MSVNLVNKDTGELTLLAGATMYADAPIGSIQAYGGTTAPTGWLLCQGQAISRTTYAELIAVIGTNYGGSGSTFNLPNLTQLKQDYTVKTQLDTWRNSLEDGSESHTFTIDKDGSYYFEVVLSNATGGKQSNNITITGNNDLVCSWGFVGSNAILQNKTIFLKAGTYVVTHLCETAGIGGTSVVTVYSTRNEPVGSYIIKMKHTPVPADFIGAVDDSISQSSVAKMLPYSFNKSQNIASFNRQFVYEGHDLTWTATHTGRLTLRLLKNGDGYSLYFYNNTTNTLMDSYDNFFGTDSQSAGCTQASITLQGWVQKGDTIRLESNLPSSTALDHTFFCQTGLLAYNNNYD